MNRVDRAFQRTVKFAARKEIKILRKMLDAGDVDNAKRFAKKLHAQGVDVEGYVPREHIKTLGGGGEGVADLVTSDERGLDVLKQFNPDAPLVTNDLLDRKKHFWEQYQKQHPDEIAGFYGETQVGDAVPLRAFRHEYVPGDSLQKQRQEAVARVQELLGRENITWDDVLRNDPIMRRQFDQAAAQQAGMYDAAREIPVPGRRGEHYVPADVYRGHGGNVHFDPETGKYKVIDVIPLHGDETPMGGGFERRALRRGGQDAAQELLGPGLNVNRVNPFKDAVPGMQFMDGGQLKAYAHRGVAPVDTAQVQKLEGKAQKMRQQFESQSPGGLSPAQRKQLDKLEGRAREAKGHKRDFERMSPEIARDRVPPPPPKPGTAATGASPIQERLKKFKEEPNRARRAMGTGATEDSAMNTSQGGNAWGAGPAVLGAGALGAIGWGVNERRKEQEARQRRNMLLGGAAGVGAAGLGAYGLHQALREPQ